MMCHRVSKEKSVLGVLQRETDRQRDRDQARQSSRGKLQRRHESRRAGS